MSYCSLSRKAKRFIGSKRTIRLRRSKPFIVSSTCPKLKACPGSMADSSATSDMTRCVLSSHTWVQMSCRIPSGRLTLFSVSDEILVFDNLSGRLHIIVHTDPESGDAYNAGCERLDQLVEQISGLSVSHGTPAGRLVRENDFRSSFARVILRRL